VLPAGNLAKEVPVDATKISPIVYELNPVPPYKEVITVPAQVPEVITPTVLREANEVTSVATNVFVPAGKVELVVAVVVRVKLLAPEVIKVDPSTKVSVADVAGAVTVTLLIEEAVTALFNKTTPEIEEALLDGVNKLPPIPTPPVTTNAPEEVEIEVCELVIFVVPPIKALPVTPSPPIIDKAATVVDDAFVAPSIVTPVPTAVIKFVELTDAPVPA
jgi:hypothetical protein